MGGKASFTPAFDAWRFYADGTESGSSPYGGAAQDANVTVNVGGGDQKIHLRIRIQETGGASGATTDDYGIDYQVNGAGGWTSITAATSRLKADTGSSLTDGSATTNRATNGISDGTGSFVAGEQEEANGVIEDHQLTSSNFTEHVWALTVVAADNANGDTLDFRVTLNAGSPGMTNSVTPRITIFAPVVNSGAGSSSGSGTLTATGASTAAASASASGSGTLSATGTGIASAAGVLDGTGTLTGDGASVRAADGALSGAGDLTATGAATGAGAGSLAGTGDLSATGAATTSGAGSMSGTGAVTATGAAVASSVGSMAGTGDVAAEGTTAGSTVDAVGSMDGTGSLSATGQATAEAVGSLAGTGDLSGFGAATAAASASAAGTGDLTATGAAVGSAAGSMAGVGDVAADGAAIGTSPTVGTMSGSGDVAAVGLAMSTVEAVGSMSGTGAMSGIGNAITETLGPSKEGGGAGSGYWARVDRDVIEKRTKPARGLAIAKAVRIEIVPVAELVAVPAVVEACACPTTIKRDDAVTIVEMVHHLKARKAAAKRERDDAYAKGYAAGLAGSDPDPYMEGYLRALLERERKKTG